MKQDNFIERGVKKERYKEPLFWIRTAVIMFGCWMFVSAIPTLERWSWGYWSYEYLTFASLVLIYLAWECYVTISRKLSKIESKLDEIFKEKN